MKKEHAKESKRRTPKSLQKKKKKEKQETLNHTRKKWTVKR